MRKPGSRKLPGFPLCPADSSRHPEHIITTSFRFSRGRLVRLTAGVPVAAFLAAGAVGDLVLRAQRSPRDGFEFIAGSISSKGKVALGPHGRLTTRQYISPGHGIGVGVCLYGSDIDDVGWPGCGEIDATEIAVARGGSPFASIHGPGYSGGSPISAIHLAAHPARSQGRSLRRPRVHPVRAESQGR